MTAENRSDHDKKGHCTVANLKKGIDCQYRIRNNSAYDLKQTHVLEEYLKKFQTYGILNLNQIDIRSTDMSEDFWYNGKANITLDTVENYFRGQLSNDNVNQHTCGLLKYKTNVLEIKNHILHKYFFWVDSLHKGNFSVIFPPLLLKRDGQCTEEEYKNLLKRAIYHIVDIDRDQLNSFEIPELQRRVYNIIIRNDYDINTYTNEHYKKIFDVKFRILLRPFFFSMEQTVVVHDMYQLQYIFEQLGTKYKRFFENLNTNTNYHDFRPFAWVFADSLFGERHNEIEYQERLDTLKYNRYLYERVLSEREENENDGGFGLLHYDNDRIPTQHYVNSNGNKKTDSKQNNPLDYITGKHLNSSVKDEREHGMLELVKHYVKYYDIEQNSFCTENEKMEFNYFISRFKKNYFQPDKNGNISNDPYNFHLSLVFKEIIYDDPSNIPLVDDKTLLCHHIPSLDKITDCNVLDAIVEQEKQFTDNNNIHHHFCVDYNDSLLQADLYQRLFDQQIDFRRFLLNMTLKETHKDFKYNRPKAKSTDMVTIHEDDSTIISIYFFRNDDRNRNFSMNGDISLNIFILRKTTGQIQTRKREIHHDEPKKNTKRSRQENEDDYESEPDDSVVSSEHDDDDSSYRPGSSEEDESSSSSSGSVSLLSDDLEVIAQQRPLDDDTMSSLTETSSIFFPSPSPMWTPSGTGGNFSRLHDPNEEDGI